MQEILNSYLRQCYRDEKLAKLDQAGERDSEKETDLNRVFIDLDVSLRKVINTQKAIYRNFRNKINKIQQANAEISERINEEEFFYDHAETLSVMECLLQELHSKIVIIGGPGQGKSTSGQQLAQIHRAKLLNEDYDDRYQPETIRIPFQVVLKDFAQWLADEPEIDALDSYLAERVSKLAKCPGDIRPQDIQEIFSKRNCLLLLDGLDEVVEPKLKKQMLNRIQDFLADRESSTENNILVVATSRPNGYDNQFDPEQFVHLELEFLSEEKVTEYAQKWVEAKRLTEEESSKTLNTLRDCQQDKHIQGLLTTPLQVTIILIIIKSGRKPPSQREDLFNEYWLTIFRREESKDRGKAIVKSKESFLLNLHSLLGYSIHRRATKENIKSLLSEAEFKELVTNFLQEKKGNCSTENDILQEMNRLVREVGERLVLIVQKEAGFYGFDLRSFQEFFAAIYLIQLAKDTKQRFDRLTAIALYEHWRNVALFAAGRIARNFSGEVTQLPEVWRSIDRTGVNLYLKPGAWLALQIAADGALSDEANLQYSAVDDGLKLLETGLTSEQNIQLKTLVGRLTQEEKQKILRQILEQKLSLLPESCLIPGLSIYGEYFGANDFFLDKLDVILQGQREASINAALDLAIEYESEPSWIAEKLQNYWNYVERELENICLEKFEYFKKILKILEISQENRLSDLLINTLSKVRYYYPRHNISWQLLITEIDKKTIYSIGDQIIIIVLLKYLLFELLNYENKHLRNFIYEKNLNINDEVYVNIMFHKHKRNWFNNFLKIKNNLQINIEHLFKYSDLTPILKLNLWQLLLLIDPNYEQYILQFLDYLSNLKENQLIELKILKHNLYINYKSYPLLFLAHQLYSEKGKEAVSNLLPFLTHEHQSEISLQIENNINKCFETSIKKEIINFCQSIRYGINLDKFFPELIPFANQREVTLSQLIDVHIYMISFKDKTRSSFGLDGENLSQIMRYEQDYMYNYKELIKILDILTSDEIIWNLEKNDIQRIIDFLENIVTYTNIFNEEELDNNNYALCLILALYLKLIDYGYPQENLLKLIENFSLENFSVFSYRLMFTIGHLLSKDKIKFLQSLLKDNNKDIFLKCAIIWQAILELKDEPFSREINISELLSDISFDLNTGKQLLQENDSQFHQIGITLLTYSNYPIEVIQERQQLLTWLKNANSETEEKEWAKFIRKIAISDDKQSTWSSFLERILSEPKQFGYLILSAAMERYQSLNNSVEITISEKQERQLGLLQ